MPHRSSVPMSWRLAKHRYRLIGSRCKACGQLHFPPRLCQCGSEEAEGYGFSGNGRIISHTTIHVAPDGFEHLSPYAVALVQLVEGPVISGHVVGDLSKISIGKNVRMVFRKLYEGGGSGIINYGFKFELVE